MIDVYEILRTKENDILRIRKEIEALRFAATLLADPSDPEVSQPETQPEVAPFVFERNVDTENLTQEDASPEPAEIYQAIPPKRSRFLNLLGLAAGE